MRKIKWLVTLAVLPIFTIPSFAYVVCYTDSWVCDNSGSYYDDSDDTFVFVLPPDAGICACGVTDGYGDGDHHEYSASIRVTDPNGSYWNENTVTSYGMGSVARADVRLPWYEVEGDYSILSTHFSNCPLNNFGQINYPIYIRTSYTSYLYESGGVGTPSCKYRKNCPPGTSSCGYNTIKGSKPLTQDCLPYGWVAHFYVNGVCVRGLGIGGTTIQQTAGCF